MTRRFWWSLALTAPIFAFMVAEFLPGHLLHRLPAGWLNWIELALATPVVLWGGWPFFQRGWASVISMHLNMFTLIALGVGAAYGYSVVATLAPGLFPIHSEWAIKWRCISSPQPSSSSWSCSARCWNCVLGAWKRIGLKKDPHCDLKGHANHRTPQTGVVDHGG